MPAMAAAALPSTRREIRLMPATSTTEYMMQTSLAPTYGDTSPEAIVDTRSLGKPIGSAAKTCAAIDEPPEPPAARTPSARPCAARSAITAAAASGRAQPGAACPGRRRDRLAVDVGGQADGIAGARVDRHYLDAGRAQP